MGRDEVLYLAHNPFPNGLLLDGGIGADFPILGATTKLFHDLGVKINVSPFWIANEKNEQIILGRTDTRYVLVHKPLPFLGVATVELGG